MTKERSTSSFALELLALTVAFLAGTAWAGDRETRDYTVSVDGKPAGEGRLTIDRRDDGVTVVDGATDVKVRVFVFKYTYSYRGREVWKNGRLQKFDSAADDDGKKYTVNAAAEATGLRVTVNGRTRVTRADVWPTSYWQLPDARLRGGPLLLLDADTGRGLEARLENLGEQFLTIEGRTQKTTHYRVTGDASVDLWFDAAERMVRQDWVEEGHRTLIELARISR